METSAAFDLEPSGRATVAEGRVTAAAGRCVHGNQPVILSSGRCVHGNQPVILSSGRCVHGNQQAQSNYQPVKRQREQGHEMGATVRWEGTMHLS
jgi:hypothetical protein